MMKTRTVSLLSCAAAIFLLLLIPCVANAAILKLDARVFFAILDHNGSPLADGSVVYIIGSTDNVNDGMFTTAGGPGYTGPNNETYVANSTQGDDVFIGEIRIGENVSSNGTFASIYEYEYDNTVIDYFYIRYFETTNEPVVGTGVYWGTSAVVAPFEGFGLGLANFGSGNQATNQSNFIVIPEPGTGGLMFLMAGLIWWVRSTLKREQKNE